MPTTDSKMVRLPTALVARWDEARGDVDRPRFLESLLGAYERGEIVTDPGTNAGSQPPIVVQVVQPAKKARRAKPKTEPAAKGECWHPPNQRMGDLCLVCGSTVAGKGKP